MPVVKYTLIDVYIVGDIHRQHTGRRPGINHSGISGIGSIGEPRRREVDAPVVGGIFVLLQFQRCVIATHNPVEKPPIGVVREFGEIGNGVLRPSRMTVGGIGRYTGVDLNIDSISGFHVFSGSRNRFGIRVCSSGRRQGRRIAVTGIFPISVVHPMIPSTAI